MAVLQCKMCGGSLIPVDATVCECDSCGTRQTIPGARDDKKTNLFNRANRLRMNAEFDKASAIYEQIVAEYPQEAEAYWGLCLCAYGIEYVDDPATGEKKPTCHRTMPTSIMEDSNFEQACDYADSIARKVYRDEAKAIDRIQRDILSIVANEQPYDVFICYKETAEDGGRTEDSVLAQDIYDALTAKGLKVFFSRITLEDKLGVQYEPYIYAALSSAKVMLAVGTQFEYYDAVWVKNEWSRFLGMMKTDKTKTLIPCFKGLDAYDMPKEFKGLQAQDMGKLGWMQDLVRGVEKLIDNQKTSDTVHFQVNQALPSTQMLTNYLQRAEQCLHDTEWQKAQSYCEKVLEIDPNNNEAYLYELMAETKSEDRDMLFSGKEDIIGAKHYKRVIEYGDEDIQSRNRQYLNGLKFYEAFKNDDYERANEAFQQGLNVNQYINQNKNINPLLRIVIEKGKEDTVKQFLSEGADSCATFKECQHWPNRMTDLLTYSIVYCYNSCIAQMLIEAGANVKENEAQLQYYAIFRDDVTLLKLLISHGANPDVSYVYQVYSGLVNASIIPGTGAPLLLFAAHKGNEEIVSVLLDNGCDPNAEISHYWDVGRRRGTNKFSVLWHCVYECQKINICGVVKVLLKAGANSNYCATNFSSKTPVLNAAVHAFGVKKANPQLIRLLLEHGANPNSIQNDEEGRSLSALYVCIYEKPDDQIAKIIIEAGADVNRVDHYVDNKKCMALPVLSAAVYKQNEKIARLLLEKGANTNCFRESVGGLHCSPLFDCTTVQINSEIIVLIAERMNALPNDLANIKLKKNNYTPEAVKALKQLHARFSLF